MRNNCIGLVYHVVFIKNSHLINSCANFFPKHTRKQKLLLLLICNKLKTFKGVSFYVKHKPNLFLFVSAKRIIIYTIKDVWLNNYIKNLLFDTLHIFPCNYFFTVYCA